MTDLAAFAEEGFDTKAWINASCAAKGQDEPLERFLAELEMRLQLGAEELEATLAECSSAALRRVPFAQQEVSRLKGDVKTLQVSTHSLLTSVSADAESAARSAAPLAALHTARSNMEAGCATLREAAELSGAFKRVEEVFSAGDLPRVADMLRSMARSLALVGDVPEFREGRGRLAALEDRLQRRVEGRLGDALQANNGQEVASLAALLVAVGRYNSLQSAYVASRMPLVTAVWDEAAALLSSSSSSAAAAAAGGGGGLGGGWLLLLYNNLMGLLEGDAAWLSSCLPGQRRQLLLALITASFDKLNKLIKEKLAALHSTRLLAGLLSDVLVAVRRLRELLAAAAAESAPATAAAVNDDVTETVRLLKMVLEPLEQQISRYTHLEEPVITQELQAALPVPAAANRPTPAGGVAAAAAAAAAEDEEVDAEVVQKLDAACSSAFACLAGVADRCMVLTGGTELPQLLLTLDKHAAGYLQRVQAAVGIISGRFTSAPSAAAAAAGAGDVTIMLQLVVLARHVSSRNNALEMQLRSTLGKSVPRLQQLAAAGLPPLMHLQQQQQQQQQHVAAGSANAGIPAAAAAAAVELLPVRLAAFPAKLQSLKKLQAAAAGSRFMCTPAANAAGANLCEAISSAVYDVLLAPVVSALTHLPGLPDWTAAAPGGGGGVMPGAGAVVPSFSAYPLAAVTAVGEYLMGLPQQLEVLMGEEVAAAAAAAGADGQAAAAAAAAQDEDEGDELAAEWLDKVVRGAGLLYAETVLQIQRLSPAGAAQLAADAEYFCNVMSALAVAPSAALITVQLFAAAAGDTWVDLASGALAGGSADHKMLKALARMRGIHWTGDVDVTAAGTVGNAESVRADAAAE